MVNKRFLQTAKRWMNKDAPIKRTVTQPRKTKPSNSGLTKILQRDENGKPVLKLEPIEKTAVHVPTQSQSEYRNLMRAYECGGWKWSGGVLPTQINALKLHREETCIGAGVHYSSGIYNGGEFEYCNREFYQQRNWKIISTQDFYDVQKITPEILKEINIWFDENGK